MTATLASRGVIASRLRSYQFFRTPTRVRPAAPIPGLDTDEVLAAIGIEAGARAVLRADGCKPNGGQRG
jgi:hypothetical protein